MEIIVLLTILLLVLIILSKKIRQLVQVLQGKEEHNACGCNSCTSSCMNRENCKVTDNNDQEQNMFPIKLDQDSPNHRAEEPLKK